MIKYLTALCLIVGLQLTTLSADLHAGDKVTGKVTTVDGDSVTVQPRKPKDAEEAPDAITVDVSGAAITVDGEAADDCSAVSEGMNATISYDEDGETVSKAAFKTRGKGGKKKGTEEGEE